VQRQLDASRLVGLARVLLDADLDVDPLAAVVVSLEPTQFLEDMLTKAVRHLDVSPFDHDLHRTSSVGVLRSAVQLPALGTSSTRRAGNDDDALTRRAVLITSQGVIRSR
jgi:hypothetical protein